MVPTSQEVVHNNVKRFKKDVETLTDVIGGDAHISTQGRTAKPRATRQCWGMGDQLEGEEDESSRDCRGGLSDRSGRAPSDTGHRAQRYQEEMQDLEKEVSPAASPRLISGLKAKKSACMGPVSPFSSSGRVGSGF